MQAVKREQQQLICLKVENKTTKQQRLLLQRQLTTLQNLLKIQLGLSSNLTKDKELESCGVRPLLQENVLSKKVQEPSEAKNCPVMA